MDGFIELLHYIGKERMFVFFKTTVLFYGVNYLSRSFALKKSLNDREKHTSITIDKLPECIKIDNQKFKLNKQGIKKDVSICLNEFTEMLSQNPQFDPTNFYNNFKPFSIETGVKNLDSEGIYFSNSRQIKIKNDAKLGEVIFHELFHESSSAETENLHISGFRRVKFLNKEIIYDIGEGLNEGYTKLLTLRFFQNKGTEDKLDARMFISLFIESLIGEHKMENLYSRGDLKGLMDSLKEFVGEKEFIIFLRKMDTFHKLIVHKGNTLITILHLKKTYKDILLILTAMFKKRLKLFEMKSDSLNNLLNSFNILCSLIYANLKYKHITWSLSSKEKQEILEDLKKSLEVETHYAVKVTLLKPRLS